MKKLFISFSGGRTSAYMTYKILTEYKDQYECVVLFANTGQEHEKTLEFIRQCDEKLGFGTVWVEAEVQEGRVGTKHRIVTFETASRKGQPYEEVIKKYGIPNQAYPHCTRELKLQPMLSYIKSLGWKNNTYDTAIGIRVDETRRVRKDAAKVSIVYPLVDWFPTTKPEIIAWWAAQPFDLEIQEHQGNCTWCWKKSYSKLLRLIKEEPHIFEFPERMEANYGLCGSNRDGTHRVFFRQNTSTQKLFELADRLIPENFAFTEPDPSANSGCGESCELYETVIDEEGV